MNRRSFFTKLGLVAASVAILPAATTYARTWVKTRGPLYLPNPAWETAPYEVSWIIYGQSIEERCANLVQHKLNCLHRAVNANRNWEDLLIND